jgi:FlaA1/EpsC-like NDP-sugar epimerase
MSPNLQRIVFQRTAKLFDLTIVAASFLAALVLASGSYTLLSFADFLALRIQIFNLLFLAAYVVGCGVTFTSCGLYVSHRLSNWPRRVREIFAAVTFITGVLFVSRSPFQFDFATNGFLFLFWLFSLVVLLLVRVFGQQLLRRMRLRGRNLRSIVIVGEGSDAAALADRIEKEPTLGYRVVQVIDAREI